MTKRLIPREAKLKARGLLNMLYKPSEVAEELGVDKTAIYKRWLPAGLPHTRDEHGHIWIHGPTAYQWMVDNKSRSAVLKDDEAWCLHCKRPVPLVNPTPVVHGALKLLKAACPKCGRTVNRGVKHD